MQKISSHSGIIRIIDANINRLKEALRVSEEVCRFVLGSLRLSRELKSLRHRVDPLSERLCAKKSLFSARSCSTDVGRRLHSREFRRRGPQDIFFANIQRAKESSRVLEEFTKLVNKKAALDFKAIRYRLYEIEKKFSSLI